MKKQNNSILETLQSAKDAVSNDLALGLIKEQLNNAVGLLEKGYDNYTLVEPLIYRWGGIENVPDVDENEEIDQDD